MRKRKKQILARTFDLAPWAPVPTGAFQAGESEHKRTFSCFHASLLLPSRMLPPRLPPVTMNWHQNDLDCLDTRYQLHNLVFHQQINDSNSLQGQHELSHPKENFHLLSALHWPKKDYWPSSKKRPWNLSEEPPGARAEPSMLCLEEESSSQKIDHWVCPVSVRGIKKCPPPPKKNTQMCKENRSS